MGICTVSTADAVATGEVSCNDLGLACENGFTRCNAVAGDKATLTSPNMIRLMLPTVLTVRSVCESARKRKIMTLNVEMPA